MTTLRIAVRDYSDFLSALGEQVRLFESLHSGIQVELVTTGIHELHDSTITDGGLRNGRFDLALLVTDWLAEGISSGSLEDLHLWHERLPLPDWPSDWPRSLIRSVVFGHVLSALPWHDGPECLVYRSDLFEDPSRRSAFHKRFGRELAPPANWQEFEETARFFTDPASGLYGTLFAGFPDGHNTLYDFAIQLWSRGGELLDQNGKPQLATPQAAASLDFYRRIVRDPGVCHPRSHQLNSTQSGDIFLAGEIAMMANWFGFATRSFRAGSPLAGKVAIAPVPAEPGNQHVSLSVFWALVMGAGSRNKDLAWEFLRFAATPERDLGITRHGTVGCRLSTWRNPELQAKIPAYREVEAISLGARQLPMGPQMADFAAIIDNVITRVLTSTESSSAILEQAQRDADNKGIRFS